MLAGDFIQRLRARQSTGAAKGDQIIGDPTMEICAMRYGGVKFFDIAGIDVRTDQDGNEKIVVIFTDEKNG